MQGYYATDHYRSISESGGVRLAGSLVELVDRTVEAVRDRSRDRVAGPGSSTRNAASGRFGQPTSGRDARALACGAAEVRKAGNGTRFDGGGIKLRGGLVAAS